MQMSTSNGNECSVSAAAHTPTSKCGWSGIDCRYHASDCSTFRTHCYSQHAKNLFWCLAFHRDMLLNILLIADLQLLRDQCQALIDQQLMLSNRIRISHDYQPKEQVLVLAYKLDKLEPWATGPFTIERVHTNGTVTIRRGPYVTECINIRRIRPYRHWTSFLQWVFWSVHQ